jgi:hypothetical protein
MKIVNLKQFLAMPDNTLFSKFAPCYFEGLQIKVCNTGERDFCTQEIADAIEAHDSGEFCDKLDESLANGTSVAMDFDCNGRDGCFDEEQLFAVYERADIEGMIELLKRCLK